MNFDTFNFSPDISEAVSEQGYESPTPIQERAILPAIEGRDVLGLAQTGTGKTAAFVLPILQRLQDGPRRQVRALILAPTRELAAQTHEAIRVLGRHTGLKSVAIFGGVNMNPQVKALNRGVEIVVACPGRLLDHLSKKTLDLRRVEILVLDEADRMCDMGFMPDIRRIVRQLPKKRQTMLFSATMPADILKLTNDLQHNAVTVQIGHTKPANTVAHTLYPVSRSRKTALVRRILNDTNTDSVIVFTRTKHRAKRLAQQLDRAGYPTTSLQGNLSQNQRERAIKGFRDGTFQVLVATDIAARGIDVVDVSHVINFDMPGTADAYTHRIGRTGRAERNGEAFTFVTGEDAEMVRSIERVLGEKIERRTVKNFDYTEKIA
ncbi:MAG: DEAD/DEAH box helicase [Thermodesulfobacteriota bacterium]|nr:DEAD/DEAH box helicase [Thermodesulfobacteriota bacterium]